MQIIADLHQKTSSEGYYDSFYKTDEEILKAAISIEEAGIPRVSCSGGYGYKGKQAVNATEIVKKQYFFRDFSKCWRRFN